MADTFSETAEWLAPTAPSAFPQSGMVKFCSGAECGDQAHETGTPP